MSPQTINIGILAHVDAGKTSLTERLLYETGVIDRLGSVEDGTTQTDTGEIERRRGITIRSAVVAFTVGDRRVNLVDTPGHSDFVAEVARALGVLDGAVLVLSAVEGVQPHTRVLMRTLRALRLPTLIFQDPLIGTRVGADGRTSVLLYGEVQKEVVAATLAEVWGVEARFLPTEVVHLERPVGVGNAYEPIGHGFPASVGLRVGPAPPGSGNRYRREVELGSLPLAFHRAIEETVGRALEQGRYGWPVTDAVVTLTRCGYWSPITVAGDFRDLTPLVLARALAEAGTRVYEPCHRFELDVPFDRLGPVAAELAQLGARIDETTGEGASWHVTGELPTRLVHAFQQRLPTLSSGEGTWTSRPGGDRPVSGAAPRRRRTDGNPFDRAEYTRFLAQRTLAPAENPMWAPP